jgi:DeoD family purine-nucleoside phosphorylase
VVPTAIGLRLLRHQAELVVSHSVIGPNLGHVTGPIHLQPTATLAERVLLPGDPGRALLLAQLLLKDPKMFNHSRGLWGYTGTAADGKPLTIQSTGMGGPSAAIVISELADLGAKRLVRVGTCGALHESLSLGEIVVATDAISADGTSRALGTRERARATPELLEALIASAGHPAHVGPVASTDLFDDGRGEPTDNWLAAGALAVEMETATLFALGHKRDLQAASVLIVSDVLLPYRIRITVEELRAAERRIGELAVRALTAGN